MKNFNSYLNWLQNKKSLTCQGCRKWFAEDNLIISPKGSFCEDCYYESAR